MAVLVAGEGVALILLAVLVAGLLRSHAEILRRLHDLGASPYDEGRVPASVTSASLPASDIEGTTPLEDPVVVTVSPTDHDTLLAFLSGGCSTCATFWEAFADVDTLDLPPHTRLVVVTKGPEDESHSAVLAVSPPGVTVVMSSAAWQDYDVPVVPYFVLVDGRSGRQVGSGTGAEWTQVRSLMTQSDADGELALARIRKADPDAAREERADRDLFAAGIRPGDTSLYPSLRKDG